MHILRRLLLIIIAPLFTLLLFLTAFDWGLVKIAGQPATVKKAVADSGVYSSVVPTLLQQHQSISSSIGTIPLTDPAIARAANQALSPAYIKQQTENAIDAIYVWLDGKTAQPDFNIDLSAAKTNFANDVAAQAQQRVSSLPRCTSLSSALTFDVYNATCLPPGVTPAAVAQTVRQVVQNDQGFIATAINAQSIKIGGSSQSVFSDQLKSLPRWYQWFKKSPPILIILTLLTAVLMFLLYPSRRKGVRRIGWTLLSVGLTIIILAWFLGHQLHSSPPKIDVNNAIAQDKIRAVLTDLLEKVDKNYWLFGIIYALLGGLLLLAPTLIRKPSPAAAGSVDLPPDEVSQSAGSGPRPRRTPPKIQ